MTTQKQLNTPIPQFLSPRAHENYLGKTRDPQLRTRLLSISCLRKALQ